ncbi:oxidoreductase, partial [Mycena olivaceomarginata]
RLVTSLGLGASLASAYADSGHTVYATARSSTPPSSPSHPNIEWIPGIDIASESAGTALASALPVHASIDILVVTAGYFVSETFEEPRWSEEVRMYTTCAVGPLFIVQALVAAGNIRTNLGVPGGGEGGEGGKVVLEGGGNYAHHASKSTLNMVGKLLIDLVAHRKLSIAEHGIAVAIVHPGFMRTDMTKNVGYHQYWDTGGAAASLIPFIDTFTIAMTGQYWAPPRRTIVLGANLPTPLQLPW